MYIRRRFYIINVSCLGWDLSFGSLCNLYNWRYKNLGNLPHVQLLPEFSTANAGLLYDFQLINVEDFQGVGESEPNPYFYQVRKNIKFLGLFCICLAELLPKSVIPNHLASH